MRTFTMQAHGQFGMVKDTRMQFSMKMDLNLQQV